MAWLMHTHVFIYENTKTLWPSCSIREVLRKAISNYRMGKGMRLSTEAFLHLKNNNLLEFESFKFNKNLQSRELILFDRCSEFPYYIKNRTIWLSDESHALTMGLVDEFADFLRVDPAS